VNLPSPAAGGINQIRNMISDGRQRQVCPFCISPLLAALAACLSCCQSHPPAQEPVPVERIFLFEKGKGISGIRTLDCWLRSEQNIVQAKETFSAALIRTGLSPGDRDGVLASLKGQVDFRRLRAGERLDFWFMPGGGLYRMLWTRTPFLKYRVTLGLRGWIAEKIEPRVHRSAELVVLEIEDSLWGAAEKAGEDFSLVMGLVDVFSWDIDFYLEPRHQDRMMVLVEKLSVEGRPAGYGRILAAAYSGEATGLRQAFYYQPRAGRAGYFDENGGSLRKAFLKTPLKFARITSGFGQRVHPILGYSQFHPAVDLSAPVGTPVWAPADGTVLFAGWESSCGKTIKLRHASGYQTVYCHLQGISPAVHPGGRVLQKQLLGWVGSTGVSTGPHLHYGMKRGGSWVNPFSQRFPPAEPVPAAEMEDFRKAIGPLRQRLLEPDFSSAAPSRQPQAGGEQG
jgi:hypothetical protein